MNPTELAGDNADQLRLHARLTIRRGNFEFEVPGAAEQLGLPANEHFWRIPPTGGRIDAALQADLSAQPTGVYEYEVTVGMVLLDDTGAHAVGRSETQIGKFIHVNTIGSPFGNGWGLAGLQRIVENADGSVLLVDGDGSEMRFGPPSGTGAPYVAPIGDFSTLEKVDEGNGSIFRRTMKDKTVFRFDNLNRLQSIIDRNANQTNYSYDAQGHLKTITDPASLVTTLTYGAGFVEIKDPANRTTRLDLDGAGNLTRITDPDSSKRSFGYDGARHLISEVDKGGFNETTVYGFHGRAESGVRGDGFEVTVDPVQVHGLFRPEATIDPNGAQEAQALLADAASANPDGSVDATELDQFGQSISERDALGKSIDHIVRDNRNRVVSFQRFERSFEIE